MPSICYLHIFSVVLVSGILLGLLSGFWHPLIRDSRMAGINRRSLIGSGHGDLPNLLELAFAGIPMALTRVILPILTKSVDSWKYTYARADGSLSPANTPVVEHGNDLAGRLQKEISAIRMESVNIAPDRRSDQVGVANPSIGQRLLCV